MFCFWWLWTFFLPQPMTQRLIQLCVHLSAVCIGGAPVFYTAAIYVAIPMLVESLDVSLSRIPPRMYYIIFINADIAALVLQASGG